MPDMYLFHNGRRCEACELRRAASDRPDLQQVRVDCNQCGGTGRLPYSAEEIIAFHIAEAR